MGACAASNQGRLCSTGERAPAGAPRRWLGAREQLGEGFLGAARAGLHADGDSIESESLR
jgi:hypothetical protein